jgi:hypothetical protein
VFILGHLHKKLDTTVPWSAVTTASAEPPKVARRSRFGNSTRTADSAGNWRAQNGNERLWRLGPSSDGAELAIPSHQLTSAKIRLILLNAEPKGPCESEIPVDRPVSIVGLNWTADGKGWFAALPTSGGSKLAFIDQAGRVTLLREHANYAIPSPDGKHAAVTIIAVTSNIWAVDGL